MRVKDGRIDNLSKILIIVSLVFPFIVISREFYLISILSIFFILYIFLNCNFIYIFKRYTLVKYMYILIAIYSLYINILTQYINKQYSLFSLNKSINLLLFIHLIIYFSNKKINHTRIKEIIMYSILGISIISLVLYFIGIDGITLGFKSGIITSADSISWFGERRINWFYEHKIQFSMTCLLGVFFVINNYSLKIVQKLCFVTILIIAIYFSNSKMALIGVIIIILIEILKNVFIKIKKINDKKSLFFTYWTSCVIISGGAYVILSLIPKIIAFIGETRDLSTLGLRTIIWDLAIKDIERNPLGIIKSYGSTLDQGYSYFSTAHNVLLNECLETGIIGGGLYLLVFILAFFMLKGFANKSIFLIVFALAQFDYLISGVFSYVFWITIALLISEGNTGKKYFSKT